MVTGRWISNRSLWLGTGRRRWIVLAGFVLALAGITRAEMQTSWLQSKLLAAAARRVAYSVAPGPSSSIRFPASGPYDGRLGYSGQARFVEQLQNDGFQILSQASWSPFAMALVDAGLFAIYTPKDQAGLLIAGSNGRVLYSARNPRRIYDRFDAIPPVLVKSLLFIENRELLQGRMTRNPAIEYDRLTRAMVDVGVRTIKPSHPVSGGSTLATQLEKLRHSSSGRTDSVAEKGRQMVSASLRAYLDGQNTMEARQQIVRAYLNALPLGAIAGWGEVIGVGDGLWAWLGADFGAVNRLLWGGIAENDPPIAQQALAYRQALSLLLAVKKPTTYLSRDPAALEARTDGYLRALAGANVISPALRDAALRIRLQPRDRVSLPAPSFAGQKSVDGVRMELLSRLGLDSAYDLDRLDLTVRTTLDGAVNDDVSRVLQQLGERRFARESGLMMHGLLSHDNPGRVVYSFTLYERGTERNLLRVQADNYDQPLNINDGTRLELGSTAKLRTLLTYLDNVEELHRQYADAPVSALRAAKPHSGDRLTRWAIDHLARTDDRSLAAMLEAAMNRQYSANSAESFFTGGGVHRFENFDKKDNRRVMTVREGFQRSVNLVFIRIMRDLVNYQTYRSPELTEVLDDPSSPARHAYLSRFADQEGQIYLRRFYRRRRDTSTVEALQQFSRARLRSATRLAVFFRAVRPEARLDEFADFLNAQEAARGLSVPRIEALYARYDPSDWSLQDLGYLAGLHPLELWLVGYLRQHPMATVSDVINVSAQQRQHAYGWLFRTVNKRAQQRAIRTLVEAEVFTQIHTEWARQGYPFGALVPSYATAIGSSGDNPAALSELLGIVLNGGVRKRAIRIEQVRFAERTPYETNLALRPVSGERVLSADVASVLRHELIGVVEHGTGRGVAGGVNLRDGRRLEIGGKTGTGDNRFETDGPHGPTSRVVNRTAAFTFTIGDRFFGTIVAFVPGREAENYGFTSALPVHVFKSLLPVLLPVFEDEGRRR
jgi:membrane peptidoglycan carboxypeptidase